MVTVPVTAAAPRALACVRRRQEALGWEKPQHSLYRGQIGDCRGPLPSNILSLNAFDERLVTASTAAKRVALDARPKSKYKKDKRPALN
jgi:hypothetical protein